MPPASRHLHLLRLARARHAIHQPVLVRDPARPPPGAVALQRLRLAEPLERGAANVLDQGVDLHRELGVLSLPMQVVRPGAGRPPDVHAAAAFPTRT